MVWQEVFLLPRNGMLVQYIFKVTLFQTSILLLTTQ